MKNKTTEHMRRIFEKTVASALFLFLLFGSHAGYGQAGESSDTLRVDFYFRRGHAGYDPSYGDNGLRMDSLLRFAARLRAGSGGALRSVVVTGSASPEGNTDAQKVLASRRSRGIVSLLSSRSGLRGAPFRAESVGIDWEGLCGLVEESPLPMPYREETSHLLRTCPEWISRGGRVVDGRKRRLALLHGGSVWSFLESHFFPELRRARVEVVYSRPSSRPEEKGRIDTVVLSHRDTVVISHRDTVYLACGPCRRPHYLSLKTNLLYDAALIPNLGLEFHLGRGWSLGGSWMYAWWNSDRRHDYWRTYGGEVSLRKYFGRRARSKPLTGHHLGVYGQFFTYDFETGGTGYMGGRPGGTLWDRLNYAGGIEYGYSLPLGRRLNMDFVIGVGYWGGEYYRYVPMDGHYVWQETRQRHWFGPTKAEISLIWLLGRGNTNEKKGGKR